MKLNLFRKKDFSLLMSAKLASNIGTQMQSFALSLYVLKITGSATKFASVIAIAIIPQIILGPIAGVFVDRSDRKKLIVALDIICAVVVALTASLYIHNGILSMFNIYLLVITLAIISAIYNPAIGSILPSILEKDFLMEGISINSVLFSLVGFISPALAGMIYGMFGIFIVLVINAGSFILSSVFEMLMKIPKLEHKNQNEMSFKVFKIEFLEGIQYIKKEKLILSLIIIGIVLNFVFNSAFSIGFTYILKHTFKITDSQYGYCESMVVGVSMLAPMLAPIVTKRFSVTKIIFLDVVGISIMFCFFAVVPSPFYLHLFKGYAVPFITIMIITIILLTISGVGNIAINTMFSSKIPIEMMGRVGSVMNSSLSASSPLGQMVFGVLLDILPTWICLFIGAAILAIPIITSKKAFWDYKDENEVINMKAVENI